MRCVIATPLGPYGIEAEAGFITRIAPCVEPLHPPESPLLQEAAHQLTAYFTGELRSFDLRLAPVGTAFQQRCWAALRDIPYGETLSYGEQARRIGSPNACRAVGGANRCNPIAIVIPCHRVIGTKGDLVGYAGHDAKGLSIKAWLLQHEAEHK